MISKEEMLALVRSVAVHDDVEQGMGHAFDLGVDWERARVQKIVEMWMNERKSLTELADMLQDIKNGAEYQ